MSNFESAKNAFHSALATAIAARQEQRQKETVTASSLCSDPLISAYERALEELQQVFNADNKKQAALGKLKFEYSQTNDKIQAIKTELEQAGRLSSTVNTKDLSEKHEQLKSYAKSELNSLEQRLGELAREIGKHERASHGIGNNASNGIIERRLRQCGQVLLDQSMDDFRLAVNVEPVKQFLVFALAAEIVPTDEKYMDAFYQKIGKLVFEASLLSDETSEGKTLLPNGLKGCASSARHYVRNVVEAKRAETLKIS